MQTPLLPQLLLNPSLLNLQSVFPRTLVLAALDLIDRGNVLKYIGPARHHYDVLGSTATHHVFINMPSPMTAYCTCPAFSFLVLSSESYIMCKHVLAAHLAHRMGRCLQQPVNSEDLASIIMQEYS
ncbi:hypothetical protein K438DRAFT_142832 [Mycena galopus ATCC 62051]|nr:hypothetical protein K438DRAFT_142832 [Mycena galopus ATCC 62051]